MGGACSCCREVQCPKDDDEMIDPYVVVQTKEQLGNPILIFMGVYTLEEIAVFVFNSPNLNVGSNVYYIKNKVVEVVIKDGTFDLHMIKKQIKHIKENTQLFN